MSPPSNQTRALGGNIVTLLGYLGVTLSVVGLAGIWFISLRTPTSIDQAADSLLAFTEEAESKAVHATGQLDAAGEKLQETQHHLDALARSEGVDPDVIRGLLAELDHGAEQLQNWMTVAQSTRDFMALLHEILESMGAVVGAGNGSEVTSALATGTHQVRAAEDSWKLLQDSLKEAQHGAYDVDLGQRATSALERYSNYLADFATGVEGFSDSVASISEAVENLREVVQTRILWATVISTFLLIWHGFAQLCLAEKGRQMSRARS